LKNVLPTYLANILSWRNHITLADKGNLIINFPTKNPADVPGALVSERSFR